MTAKPSHETEVFAARTFAALEDERLALVDELERPDPPAPPDSSAFLSDRLRRDWMDGKLASVANDLRTLDCDGSVRESCRSLIAYFLTYRFLDLSDLTNPAAGRQVERHWDLPEGHDTLWSDVLTTDAKPATKTMAMLPSRVTAAPWLGALRPLEILRAIRWMTEIGLIEFAYDEDIVAAGSDATGVPVLRLRPDFHLSSVELQRKYETILWNIRAAESARHNLVVDLGTGIRAVGGFHTYQMIADASSNDLVKIATYHLRTIVGERSLADWLAEKKTLRVKILCLGPTGAESLTEGADPDSLADSLQRGVHSFREMRRSLPPHLRKHVETRVYGDVEAEALFRGAILCTSGQPKRVVATTWPFGECRANYGNLLLLEGDSNLSRLLSAYFDSAWANSVPVGSGGKLERFRWAAASVRIAALSAAGIGVVASIALAVQPGVNSDAFFALVGSVPVLVYSMFHTVRRLHRASRLSLTIRKHH